jgi:hypothetical protein
MAPAWSDRWRVVAPAGAVRLDVDLRGRTSPAPARGAVALCASGPFARWRVRRAAARAGVALEREYLALPSAGSPAFLVEDAPGPIDYFRVRILTAPPGTSRLGAAADLAVQAVQHAPRRLVGALAPGRVAIGRRP